jgi:hypothetical protein
MIEAVLRYAHRLDAWLRLRLGPSYHAILGFGLLVEIARHIHELAEIGNSAAGMIRSALQLILYSVLLIHQLGELSGHLAARREAAGRRAPR